MEKISKLKKITNKIYYNLFVENFNEKIEYNFTKNYFRWNLIDYITKKKFVKTILKLVVTKINYFQK